MAACSNSWIKKFVKLFCGGWLTKLSRERLPVETDPWNLESFVQPPENPSTSTKNTKKMFRDLPTADSGSGKTESRKAVGRWAPCTPEEIKLTFVCFRTKLMAAPRAVPPAVTRRYSCVAVACDF